MRSKRRCSAPGAAGDLTLLDLIADVLVERTDIEGEEVADLLAETEVILQCCLGFQSESDRILMA
jgi:hypothetical protein